MSFFQFFTALPAARPEVNLWLGVGKGVVFARAYRPDSLPLRPCASSLHGSLARRGRLVFGYGDFDLICGSSSPTPLRGIFSDVGWS